MSSRYTLKLALQSLYREKVVNLLAMLTIGGGLFIASFAFLLLANMEHAVETLPEQFAVIVYLDKEHSKEDLRNIATALKTKNIISSVRYISKEDALRELQSIMKSADAITAELGENPLPESLEVKLRSDAVDRAAVKSFSEEIKKLKGVSEVSFGDEELNLIQSFRNGVKVLGLIIISVISAGIIFICYSTVKILFYRKTEEIETFKLLGATPWFVRTPFLIEGSVLGLGGGLFSLAAIIALSFTFSLNFPAEFPAVRSFVFPVHAFLVLPFIGTFLGLAGSLIAVGRVKY